MQNGAFDEVKCFAFDVVVEVVVIFNMYIYVRGTLLRDANFLFILPWIFFFCFFTFSKQTCATAVFL